MTIKIALGSSSEDKLSILNSYLEIDGLEAEVTPVKVDSKVSNEPKSEEETIKGAVNRASEALKSKKGFDWGVGMEGGLEKINGSGYFLVCAVAIVDSKDQLSLGVSSKLELPSEVSKQIDQGAKFGESIRKYHDAHPKGASCDLAGLLVTRREAFIQALVNALMFMRSEESK